MTSNRGRSPGAVPEACYRLAIFDFDGTLADSFPFFLSVFDQLARTHGFNPVAAEDVPALRRYNARELMRHVGLPAWKLPMVAKDFIGQMRSNRHRVPLFEGMAEVLGEVKQKGVALAVVSSNSYDNVLHVLKPEVARLVRHFECGVSIFGKRARLRKVLRESGVPREAAIYIGDQATDLDAARAEGIAFGAVAWGYGDFDALRALSPEEAFASVAQIRKLCA